MLRFSLCICLVLGCGVFRQPPRSPVPPDPTNADLDPLHLEPAAPAEDPPQLNPIRDLLPDSEPEPPIAGSSEREVPPPDPTDPMIDGLLSAWTDNRVIDLLFPENRFQFGPEFLDGGPNTLYWLCVEDGTPEHVCRQRFAR